MSERLLWCAIGLLSAVCAAQACHIRSMSKGENAEPPIENLLREQDRWFAEARKSMRGGAPAPFRRFDDLFDDDFFGRRFDPFAELEGFQRRMAPLLPDEQRPAFGRSWKEWFQDRMELDDIRFNVRTTDKEVVVSLRIPGLKDESLRVDVNDDRIRLAYDAKSVEEEKDARGTYRTESSRHFQKIMPIPKEADPKTPRIVHEGDAVKIIFERRRT